MHDWSECMPTAFHSFNLDGWPFLINNRHVFLNFRLIRRELANPASESRQVLKELRGRRPHSCVARYASMRDLGIYTALCAQIWSSLLSHSLRSCSSSVVDTVTVFLYICRTADYSRPSKSAQINKRLELVSLINHSFDPYHPSTHWCKRCFGSCQTIRPCSCPVFLAWSASFIHNQWKSVLLWIVLELTIYILLLYAPQAFRVNDVDWWRRPYSSSEGDCECTTCNGDPANAFKHGSIGDGVVLCQSRRTWQGIYTIQTVFCSLLVSRVRCVSPQSRIWHFISSDARSQKRNTYRNTSRVSWQTHSRWKMRSKKTNYTWKLMIPQMILLTTDYHQRRRRNWLDLNHPVSKCRKVVRNALFHFQPNNSYLC